METASISDTRQARRREDQRPPVFGGSETIAEAIRRNDRLHEYVEVALSSPWLAEDIYGDAEELGTAEMYEFIHCVNHHDYRVANRPRFALYPGTSESRQVASHNLRGKIEGVDYCLTDGEWQNILREFRHKCAYCDHGGELQLEHLLPVVMGGGTEKWNVVPSCPGCNQQKGAKDPVKWLGVRYLEEIRARLRRANP